MTSTPTSPTDSSHDPFPGSYLPEETLFLLRRMQLTTTPLQERERRIQSGRQHYSEMIGPEDAPTRGRLKLFRECLENNGAQLARDVVALANALAESAHQGEVTITSIARAGTPIGCLLWHLLRRTRPDLKVQHYSISVIRDRGVDYAALRWILERHAAESIRFIDGWTGKGTIATELRNSLATKPELGGIDPGLWTPLDVCGASKYAPNAVDYLIPSTLLGGTISGLVSRSVLPRGEEDTGVWHGSVELSNLKRYDLSRWFIRKMLELCDEVALANGEVLTNASGGKPRFEAAHRFLDILETEHAVASRNQLKLGIGESVRVLLRRLPKLVLLSPDARELDANLIRRLADLRKVPIQARIMPFAAVALIANVADA